MPHPFVWFWSFWYWCTESYSAGALLRTPLHSIASHWDEWYRFEASDADRDTIDRMADDPRLQRRFIGWLIRHWGREARWEGERLPMRFVLAQLAQVSPFDHWPGFASYRDVRAARGISAVVLGEDSAGNDADVRAMEAVAIPQDLDPAAPAVIADGFTSDAADLDTAHAATRQLLGGRGLLRLLLAWTLIGRRPLTTVPTLLLIGGWILVAGLLVWLRFGVDPGAQLVPLTLILVGVWGALVATALTVWAWTCLRAARLARAWRRQLDHAQVYLRMSGGLTLIGGSAGVPFALNILLAVTRVAPDAPNRSWLWRRVVDALRTDGQRWAATGMLRGDGRIMPVALEQKLRACLLHPSVTHVLTPRQPEARRAAIEKLARLLPRHPKLLARAPRAELVGARFGYASELPLLESHQHRTLAAAILDLGGLRSGWQPLANAFALVVSVVVIAGASDLRGILLPAPAPVVVAPFSPTTYQLWVSLDTRRPQDFAVTLESVFWANRRADVTVVEGAAVPPRAELRMTRRNVPVASEIDHGTVWIERRRHFLGREYAPGERVGQYTVNYLSRYLD